MSCPFRLDMMAFSREVLVRFSAFIFPTLMFSVKTLSFSYALSGKVIVSSLYSQPEAANSPLKFPVSASYQ